MVGLFQPQNARLLGTGDHVLHKVLAGEPVDQQLAAAGDFGRAEGGETLRQALSAGKSFGSVNANGCD